MTAIMFGEIAASAALAIVCAYFGHHETMRPHAVTRLLLAALALATIARAGSLIALSLDVATLSPALLGSARAIAPGLCAAVLIAVMTHLIRFGSGFDNCTPGARFCTKKL